MSQTLINHYLAQLDRIRRISGSTRESVLREAFKDLLKAWGRQLMDLHIGYEQVEPAALRRTDVPDTKASAAGQSPKCVLKAEPAAGRIVVDSETVLDGVPAAAWGYKLGNRSAIDWVLDQHKEKKPKYPTVREKFDTYRFADHKARVIDLLARVVTVSVQTQRIVAEMQAGPR